MNNAWVPAYKILSDTVFLDITSFSYDLDSIKLILNLSQNAFSSALDWKSSKVIDEKVGYIGTVGNTISMMARDADNSKFSMRDQATREYLNIGYAVGTYLSLKRVPAPVSAGVNTIADERFEEFKDREVPPKTKEQIEKDNEKYVREKIEERLD